MCGRYTQTASGEAIAKAFGLKSAPDVQPRYNIAPTQAISAIVQSSYHQSESTDQRPEQHPEQHLEEPTGREHRFFQWGLVPSWSKDPKIGSRMINARSETVAEKPSFRAALKRRRCLVLADGFYEWQRTNGKKQPYYIQVEDQDIFGFAGLWETWQNGEGSHLETCTILTTEPNGLMETIHNRMPVIIHPEDFDLWLDPSLQDGRHVQHLLRPYEDEAMDAYAVSTAVNNPRNEQPECIEPIADGR